MKRFLLLLLAGSALHCLSAAPTLSIGSGITSNAREYSSQSREDPVRVHLETVGVEVSYRGDGTISPFVSAGVSVAPIITLVEGFVSWDYSRNIDTQLVGAAMASTQVFGNLIRVGIGIGVHANLLVLSGEIGAAQYVAPVDNNNGFAEFDGFELGFGPAVVAIINYRLTPDGKLRFGVNGMGSYDVLSVGSAHPIESGNAKLSIKNGIVTTVSIGISYEL